MLANGFSERLAPPRLPLSETRSQTEVNGSSHEQMSDALCESCWARAERRGKKKKTKLDDPCGEKLKGGKIWAEANALQRPRPPTETEGNWSEWCSSLSLDLIKKRPGKVHLEYLNYVHLLRYFYFPQLHFRGCLFYCTTFTWHLRYCSKFGFCIQLETITAAFRYKYCI